MERSCRDRKRRENNNLASFFFNPLTTTTTVFQIRSDGSPLFSEFSFFFLPLKINLQVNERAGSLEGSVLDGRDLISPQIDFKKIGQVSEHAIRFNPDDLIVVQNPGIEIHGNVMERLCRRQTNNCK